MALRFRVTVENYVEALSESKEDHCLAHVINVQGLRKISETTLLLVLSMSYGSFDVSGGVNVGLMAGSDVA